MISSESGDRIFDVRDRVSFDCRNVLDTAQHCRARNPYLQSNADSSEAVAEMFMEEVLKHIQRGEYRAGQVLPIYNAWVVIDEITPDSKGVMGGQDIAEARLRANFFVRLGRQPSLREITEFD